MENQTDSEYDSIKLVREIQLMRHLNKISKKIDNKANTFIPELIDIICLELPANQIQLINNFPDENTSEALNGTMSTGNSSGNSK
jgi:hypothetical protein